MSSYVPSVHECHCGYCAVVAKIDGLYVISVELEKKLDSISDGIERIEAQVGYLFQKVEDVIEEIKNGESKYDDSKFGFKTVKD